MIAFFLISIAVVVILAIVFRKRNDAATAPRPSALPEGIRMVRQRAEESCDTEAVRAIDNGTYKQLMEQRAAKRLADSDIDYMTLNIAGINYRRNIAHYVGDSTGCLKPEPTNRHDPNAIAIYADDGHHLGYVPAFETDSVRALHLRFPIPVSVYIEECYESDSNRRFFVGQVTIKYKKK